MAFTTLTQPQTAFLESYLRGTGREITEADAAARFGIQNLRARMTDLRNAGLVVRKGVSTTGKTKYSVSARDIYGSRAKVFAE